MKTPQGDQMESWIVTLGISVFGWGVMLAGYIFDQGRQRQKIKDITESVSYDRDEFKRSLAKLEGMFIDQNGNPRLVSVDVLRDHCTMNHDVCRIRFDNIVKSADKVESDQAEMYREVFARLNDIERVTTRIATKMDISTE